MVKMYMEAEYYATLGVSRTLKKKDHLELTTLVSTLEELKLLTMHNSI